MAYRGRLQLGGELFVGLLCTDANRTPVAPTEAVTMDVWSSSAKVLTKLLPAVDVAFLTGLFGYRLFLGTGFATGLYDVFYRYRAGGVNYLQQDAFEIVPGGHADGAVISMYAYVRPGANYLIQQLDSGKLVRGKNPRF